MHTLSLHDALPILQSGRLTRGQMLRVSANAAGQPRTNLGMMSGRTQAVTRISVDDALRGLMVHSANDAAVVLGEALGDNRAGFAAMMNAKARQLGMRNSNFFNANGLGDPSQVTTARDMVTLLQAIQRDFPALYDEYFGIRSFTYRGTTWTNTNRLLGSEACPGIDGGKTGYIRAAGSNIVLSAERGDRPLRSRTRSI
jgi:D-alanyl-D-alanine carboxypeptidase